jgi:hypothetical protein
MTTVANQTDGLPAEVRNWLGHVVIIEESEFPIEAVQIENFCAAVEDGNPLYWRSAVADQVTAGRIAPPAMLSSWARPHMWSPDHQVTDGGSSTDHRPLGLHFRLKGIFGLPKAVVIGTETTYYEPARLGDRVRAEHILDEVEGPSKSRLGPGRKWTLSIHYRRQDGVLLGIEQLRFFAYRAETAE